MFAFLQLVKLNFCVNFYLFIHLLITPHPVYTNYFLGLLFSYYSQFYRIFCTPSLLNLLRGAGNFGEVLHAGNVKFDTQNEE